MKNIQVIVGAKGVPYLADQKTGRRLDLGELEAIVQYWQVIQRLQKIKVTL